MSLRGDIFDFDVGRVGALGCGLGDLRLRDLKTTKSFYLLRVLVCEFYVELGSFLMLSWMEETEMLYRIRVTIP